MGASPAFQFYVGDWLKSTALLSSAARGAHLSMMCHSWELGPIVNTPNALARAMALGQSDPPASELWDEFKHKWHLTPKGWINARLERTRAEQEAFRRRQSDKGKASASARNKPTGTQPEVNHGSTGVQPALQPEGQPEPQPNTQPEGNPSSSSSSSSSLSSSSSPTHAQSAWRAPAEAERQNPHGKTTNLVNGSELRRHGVHAWCDMERQMCVPLGLHAEFKAKGMKSDAEMRAWYPTVIASYAGRPFGDDLFPFWRSAFEQWIGTVSTRSTPSKTSSTMAAVRRVAAQLEGK